LFQEVFGAEDGMIGSYERFEHRELLGGEVKLPPVAVGGMAQGIEFDAGRAEDAGPGGGLAPGQSADPEHQFGEVEGLGQVVVAPRLRPLTRSSGELDAVSMSTMTALPLLAIIRQIVSPCTPGRSRSRTTTS
jgi:hypothetical protein